jgi:hypothetical protein
MAHGAGRWRRSYAAISPRTLFCSNTELTLPIPVYFCQAELSKKGPFHRVGLLGDHLTETECFLRICRFESIVP